MAPRSCYSLIRASVTKWSSVLLTVYFVFVFLVVPWPENFLLLFAVLGVPRGWASHLKEID